MTLIQKYDKMKDELLNKFAIAEKNEKLVRGSQDVELKKFIKSILSAMIRNYDDEGIYFGLVFVLGEFVYDMSDYETSYQVWTNVSLDKLNDISSGVKEEIETLEEIKAYYSK